MRRALLVIASVAACSGEAPAPDPPRRPCGVTAWYRPTRESAVVELAAGWDGWKRHPMARAADGWRALALAPPPGEQQYVVLEDGAYALDPTVGTTAFATIDGKWREVTSVEVGRCDVPTLRIDSVDARPTGRVRVEARFLASKSPVDAASVTAKIASRTLAATSVDSATGAIVLETTLAPGKHRLLFEARDTDGKPAEPALATAWIEPRPWDWRDAIVYQIVVDRYRDEKGAPLSHPTPISGRAGGKLEGVRRAIESGELASMGVNAIWLSPLYENPTGEWPGADGRGYSSYHGYWPLKPRAIEPLFGGEGALDALVSTAHAHGIRVIFDVVPNHVHDRHPYVAAHAKDGWFNGKRREDGTWTDACVCGAPACDWSASSLSCWFTPYLPDVDWRNLDAARTFTDDVAWFIDRFDGDGVRIDAVPLMPRAATRRIAAVLRRRFDHPGQRTFVLGETFTGADGYDALRFFLGPFGLDSEFDFPLMWALRSALAERRADMRAVDTAIHTSEVTFEGSGAVISNILGNHDVPRFSSVANGDGARDGWDPAPQPGDAGIYARMGVAFGILFALPGAPTVYYGDEVGLAGGGDPDSRRVFPRESELSPAQTSLRDLVRKLGKARSCLAPLRRGRTRTLAVDPERLVLAREHEGTTVVVVATRENVARLESPLPGISGEFVDVLSGATRTFDPSRSAFEEPSASVRWYVRRGSPCAP